MFDGILMYMCCSIVVDVIVYDIFLTHSHSKKRCCNYAVGYYMHFSKRIRIV